MAGKCQRCGKELTGRAPGTKWCFDCATYVSNERTSERRSILKYLTSRDTCMEPVKNKCPVCTATLTEGIQNFCTYCGQRLRGVGMTCQK